MSVADRLQRLLELESAAKSWAKSKKADLDAQVARNKQILKGRTGSERLAQAALQETTAAVTQEIEDFLRTT